tara:strand:+ start:8675 stop:12619 length:3945 start_codon:yes stop_codon:yes gene_type:complete
MNIDGDFVTRFGARLPVPYMEKIVIKNQSFEIQLSFYIKPPKNDELESNFYTDYINSLENLKVSIVTVADGVKTERYDSVTSLTVDDNYEEYTKKYGPISHTTTGTALFDKLLDNTINVLQIATPTNIVYNIDTTVGDDERFFADQVRTYDDLSWAPPNCSTVLYHDPLSLSEYTKEDLYNSQGELIHKYTTNIEITHNPELRVGGDTISAFVNKMLSGLKTNFVAFTTSLQEYPNEFTEEQRTRIINNSARANIMFSQVSDLSYEQISADRAIKGSETTVFKTANGEHFDGFVLQAIDSMYYGNSQLTNDNIVSSFSDLIGTTSDSELQAKFDDLAYTLIVHGGGSDILVKLNEFRKTFVETSTATPVGRFHEKLEIRLYNTNNAVKRGIPLQKMFNLSPTVVDGRETSLEIYEHPEFNEYYSWQKATNYIYTKRAKLGAYSLPCGYSFSTDAAQAQVDGMSEQLARLTDGLEAIEAQCQEAYDQIWVKINEAFQELEDSTKGSQLNEGIPEFVPSPCRLHRGDYLFMSIDGLHGPNDPTTISSNSVPSLGLTVDLNEMYLSEGGDVDGDGFFNGSPSATSLTVKLWPFDHRYYARLLNDKNIKIGPKGASRTSVTAEALEENTRKQTYAFLDSNATRRRKIYKTLDVTGMSWTSSAEQDAADDSGFDWGRVLIAGAVSPVGAAIAAVDEATEAATSGNIDASGGKVDYMNYFLLVKDADLEEPNTFIELATALMYADWQSGDKTNIIRTDDSEGEWAGIDWTGSDDDKEVKSVTFDSGMKIKGAIEKFTQNYEAYLDALIEASHINESIKLYEQVVALGGEAGVDLIYTKYNNYLRGFVFFDYEKALNKMSDISKALNVEKIETLFGRQLTHTYFKVMSAEMEKFYDLRYADLDPTQPVDYAQQVIPASELIMEGVTTDFNYSHLSGLNSIGANVPNHNDRVTYDSVYPSEPEPLGRIISYPYNQDPTEGDGIPDYGGDNHNSSYHLTAIALPDVQHMSFPTKQRYAGDAQGAELGTYVSQPSWGNPGFLGQDERKFTYLIPRSFQFASPTADHNYRLLCYEFQDVAGSFEVGAGADGHGQPKSDVGGGGGSDYGADYLFDQNQFGNSYIMAVNVEDRTADMYANIVKTFTQAINEYDVYYDALIEECSHNFSDGRMNKFFIDGVLDSYSGAPHLAPWYRVPLVYFTHQDLVLNRFGSSMELIKAAAIDLSQRLHPANITLNEAESFRDLLRDFFERFYRGGTGSGTGAVTDRMPVDLYKKIHKFGGSDHSTNGYVAIIPSDLLPKSINLDYLGYSYLTGDVVAVDTDDMDV